MFRNPSGNQRDDCELSFTFTQILKDIAPYDFAFKGGVTVNAFFEPTFIGVICACEHYMPGFMNRAAGLIRSVSGTGVSIGVGTFARKYRENAVSADFEDAGFRSDDLGSYITGKAGDFACGSRKVFSRTLGWFEEHGEPASSRAAAYAVQVGSFLLREREAFMNVNIGCLAELLDRCPAVEALMSMDQIRFAAQAASFEAVIAFSNAVPTLVYNFHCERLGKKAKVTDVRKAIRKTADNVALPRNQQEELLLSTDTAVMNDFIRLFCSKVDPVKTTASLGCRLLFAEDNCIIDRLSRDLCGRINRYNEVEPFTEYLMETGCTVAQLLELVYGGMQVRFGAYLPLSVRRMVNKKCAHVADRKVFDVLCTIARDGSRGGADSTSEVDEFVVNAYVRRCNHKVNKLCS